MRCLSHEQEQLEAGINPLFAARPRCAPERATVVSSQYFWHFLNPLTCYIGSRASLEAGTLPHPMGKLPPPQSISTSSNRPVFHSIHPLFLDRTNIGNVKIVGLQKSLGLPGHRTQPGCNSPDDVGDGNNAGDWVAYSQVLRAALLSSTWKR
jgi:hypothetical protein